MKRNNKKALYESIMKAISKEVKKVLNEDQYIEDDEETYNAFDICREILDHYDIKEDDENWIGVSDIDEYLDTYYPEMSDNDRWFVHDRMEKFVNVDPYHSVRYQDEDDEY